MAPRKTRSVKSSAPSPSPALSTSSRSSRSSTKGKKGGSVEQIVEEELEVENENEDDQGEGQVDLDPEVDVTENQTPVKGTEGDDRNCLSESDAVVSKSHAVRDDKEEEEDSQVPAPIKSPTAKKGKKGKSKASAAVATVVNEAEEAVVEDEGVDNRAEDITPNVAEEREEEEEDNLVEPQTAEEESDAPASARDEEVVIAKGKGKSTVSMEDRLQKMKDLRIRMNQSTAQNRKDLVADHQKQKVTARDLARLEKQKKLAHTLRSKVEAEENGQDLERLKNWEYSIEQNEKWEKKMEHQKVVGDSSFHNAEDDAHKLYNRNLKSTKPDLESYNRQKQAALNGYDSTIAVASGSGSRSGSRSKGGLSASEDLYRGADTLAYGDHRPDDDAVDRVIGKINKDLDKKTKKKRDESNDEVTYINERNKVFNKKIARYFDKYTKEIRANFERGTAL